MKKANAINIKNFRIKDSFWSSYQKLVREEVLPYQHAMLEDQVSDAEKSHAIENFRIAAGLSEGEFYGWVFQDSDVAKWIEACAFSLINSPNPLLEATVDEVISIIEKAQSEDGYLNTYFTIKEPERRWTDLQECHELYCAGHMMEAAVAYYEATGKDKLLNVSIKLADHIDKRFGKNKVRGFSGHPEIELALMKLYRTTGEERYLRLCEYFVNERGTEPNFFKEEATRRGWSIWNMDWKDLNYAQNQAPVREQKDAVGHAVRAVYLYTAMADLAAELADDELKKACQNLWESITNRRMYITGGIGSTVIGEAFTEDYDLPNDTNYSESCASIGLIFFAQKMLEMSVKGEYADVMERALYNTVLAGMSLDGRRFFYVNPLEVTPGISGVAQTLKHSLPERPKWFGCACCPPNIARMISSLSLYAWMEQEDTVYSNLFIGGEADFTKSKGCKIAVETNYPYDGKVIYKIITQKQTAEFRFAIRIPGWSEVTKTQILLNGEALLLTSVTKDGFAAISRKFVSGDTIELNLDMSPYRIYANTLVRQDEGCVALQAGPLVYCFEGVDNGGDVHSLRLQRESAITVSERVTEWGRIRVLSMGGYKLTSKPGLYSRIPPEREPFQAVAVPYYTWGNRGLNQMRVWMPQD